MDRHRPYRLRRRLLLPARADGPSPSPSRPREATRPGGKGDGRGGSVAAVRVLPHRPAVGSCVLPVRAPPFRLSPAGQPAGAAAACTPLPRA
ncbi:hypothetical protein STXM2123_5096 [Streptomyces sp. F-3]|nr:hypothetical protein STXM2123_5096 [Streptomyces sp. F-3]